MTGTRIPKPELRNLFPRDGEINETLAKHILKKLAD